MKIKTIATILTMVGFMGCASNKYNGINSSWKYDSYDSPVNYYDCRNHLELDLESYTKELLRSHMEKNSVDSLFIERECKINF